MPSRKQRAPVDSPEAADGTFRSSAVARMAGMPVATLRIWEQRHRAVQPATAATGHRRYSPADVQRVMLLRDLTERGHAIGSIALLDSDRLRQLHQDTLAGDGHVAIAAPGAADARSALRIVVVGPALALRLQRPAVARSTVRPPRVIAVFDSLDEAAIGARPLRADLLVLHAPELHPGATVGLQAAADAWRARQVAVVYRFAGSSPTQAVADVDALVVREAPDDASLGSWLASVEARLPARNPRESQADARETVAARSGDELPPRRYDDATLTALAGMSSTLACECPRHVAELLMQLSSFERYSAGCIDRSPADARLHDYLRQVAGASRAMFESALERVAQHENLPLRPAPARPPAAGLRRPRKPSPASGKGSPS